MKPFVPPTTEGQPGGSAILDRVMTLVQMSLDSLVRAVTNDRLIPTTILTTGTKVYHGLGEPLRTWEVVRMQAPGALIWEAAVQPNIRQVITLVSSADVVVILRVT